MDFRQARAAARAAARARWRDRRDIAVAYIFEELKNPKTLFKSIFNLIFNVFSH